MKTGTIIFINGTSSSGKSTLLRGLQAKLTPPYLEMGLDKFIWMLPKRYLEQPLWNDVLGKADTAGPVGHKLVFAMHQSILAAAKAGFNILADHVLVEPHWVQDCADVFLDFNAYLIGVKCELAILEKRERERKDRTWGQARLQYEKAHAHGVYDFEVDSGEKSAEENVMQIVTFLEKDIPPKAFKIIYQSNQQQF